MNKTFKNLISIIAALTLCYAMFGVITAMADPVRNLSVELLGIEKTDGSIESKKRLTDSVGETFWIGVTADNLDSHTLFTNGIYSFEIAFEYDPTYVTPYTSGSDTEGSWKQKIADGNLLSSSDASYDTTEWWDADLYEVAASAISTDVNDSTYRKANPTGNTTGWKTCSVTIRVKVTDSTFETAFNSSARFKGLTDSSKQTFIKLPFKVVSAPSNPIDNPVVLNLVRGPETFDISSGVYGVDPHYEWYRESVEADTDKVKNFISARTDENLRLLFDDNADITLFGVGGASITDIAGAAPTPEPVAAGEPTPTPEPTVDSLSRDKSMNAEGFDSEIYTYYLSVPNEVDKLILNITSSNQPDSVVANGSNVTLDTVSSGVYTYQAFDLAELDKTAEPDGFNNTVVVTDNDGSTAYTIYVRRLLKPKIVLNYGNSPYGEIMRDDAITDKDAAKTAFNTGNKFTTSYLPTDCTTDLFSPKAWDNSTDSDVNMDRNDYAIFVYNRKSFKDPGFEAYDAMGDPVADTDITRTLPVKRMSTNSYTALKDANVTDETITVTGVDNDASIALGSTSIRPDTYTMTYTFNDPITLEEVSVNRYVVVIWTLGDVDLSTVRNSGDSSTITSYLKGVTKLKDGVATNITNIYFYRIIDVDRSGVLNAGDGSTITSILKGVSKEKTFYRELK